MISLENIRQYIGGYAAAMNGIDAVVFTGGIGENSDLVREASTVGLDFLGLDLDPDVNRKAPRGQEMIVSKASSRSAIIIIPTNEERVIARDVVRVLGGVMPSFSVPSNEAPR